MKVMDAAYYPVERAGRPRPATSDLDGRDARRSIVHGSRDEGNRADVLFRTLSPNPAVSSPALR